jgi:hypothetical protein
MKNLFSKCAAIVCAVTLSTFIIQSCAVEDLTKDLTIYTGNGFLTSPISIQVADAAKLETVPTDLAISVEGRDKAKIFTIFGESKIRVVSGVVALAVKIADAPTVAKPLEFTLVFSAPNYVTVRKNYSLTESKEISSDKVAMINLTATPSGVSVQNTSFTTTTTGTAADVAFASPLSNGKVEQANITVKAGTKPLAADGTALTGAVATQLVHYDTRSTASLSGLAEGFGNLSVKNGAATSKVAMNPAGFYSLSMTAGGKEVSSLSTPLDVTMDIDQNYYNETADRIIQAGDVLDIISRTEAESVWTNEGKATVVSVGGKLKVSFKQPHLSIWVIGFMGINACITQNELKVLSDIPAVTNKATDCTARETFKYALVNANNAATIYSGGESTLANGQPLTSDVIALGLSARAKLQVYNAAGTLLYTSPAQTFCANRTFDLRGKLPANKSVVAKLNVSAFCGGAINTVLTPSNVQLWYRNMASPANTAFGAWSPLVTIVDGKACAKGLVAGESYDFAMPVATTAGQIEMQTFSKELKQPNGLKIPATGNLTVDVVSTVYNVNTTLTINKLADGTYDLTYLKYPLPANICTELDKKFSVFLKKK